VQRDLGIGKVAHLFDEKAGLVAQSSCIMISLLRQLMESVRGALTKKYCSTEFTYEYKYIASSITWYLIGIKTGPSPRSERNKEKGGEG
jgi:hypothetical protein